MANCRSCGAEVIWVLTSKGKRMPLDAQLKKRPEGESRMLLFRLGSELGGTPTAEVTKASSGYQSHYATCPDAGKWRKGRR